MVETPDGQMPAGRTPAGRTDRRRLDGYTISSHCEPNSSGELKSHLPLIGHNFQNKCSSESCCFISSTFGVLIPTVDRTKKTASKKLKGGDRDLLTLQPFGLEKVAS